MPLCVTVTVTVTVSTATELYGEPFIDANELYGVMSALRLNYMV
jgi:hypothetical protein